MCLLIFHSFIECLLGQPTQWYVSGSRSERKGNQREMAGCNLWALQGPKDLIMNSPTVARYAPHSVRKAPPLVSTSIRWTSCTFNLTCFTYQPTCKFFKQANHIFTWKPRFTHPNFHSYSGSFYSLVQLNVALCGMWHPSPSGAVIICD